MDATIVALATLAGLGVAVAMAIRLVPTGHTGVVVRGGRVARTRSSGLVPMLPGLEHLELVPRQVQDLHPLVTTAVTRDGVEVRLVVSVLWEVTHPETAAAVVPDARTAATEAIERSLHHAVARVELSELLRDREAVLDRLAEDSGPMLRRAGAALLDIDLLDVEVRVGPELLRLLA